MNLPNAITLFRIALVPVLVWILRDEGPGAAVAATACFLVGSISDWLDGFLARRWDLTTTLGKFLDPLADKLLVAASLIMVVGMDRPSMLPAWLVVVVIGRDLAITGLRAIASGEGIILPAEDLGKYKTLFQIFAIHGLLLHYPWRGLDFQLAGMYFLWISTALSLWSAVVYTAKVWKVLGVNAGPQES